MRLSAFFLLATGLSLLASCAEDAEAGSTVDAELEEVQGVSLEQPVVKATPPDVSEKATGDDAVKELAENLLGTDVTSIDDLGKGGIEVEEGERAIAWGDLSMEGEPMEDILDKLLYPDEFEADEFNMPDYITELNGKEVAIVGYQIPLVWEDTTVPEFMLVGDLLGCCFGGAPQPDEWIEVKMKGKGADYFPYIPVIVRGTLRVEGIEDEAGYAAGCYHIDAVSVEKEL